MTLENKRHLCFFCGALIIGILIYHRPGVVWLLWVGIGLFVIWILIKQSKVQNKEKLIAGCLIAAGILLGFCLSKAQFDSYVSHKHMLIEDQQYEMAGIICQKEEKGDTIRYQLKTKMYGRILLYGIEEDLAIGSHIQCAGEIKHFEPATNDGSFDQKLYQQTRNVVCSMYVKKLEMEAIPEISVRETLYQLQACLARVYQQELNEQDAGILCTLVLGKRSLMDEEVLRMYQDAGVSHILAISGLHISFLGMSIYSFLRKRGVSYVGASGTGCVILFLFALMSGMGVSAMRAWIMYLVMMVSYVLGRTYDGANALAIAAIVILIRNPMSLFTVGFLFSFTAMGVIIGVIPYLNQLLEDKTVIANKAVGYMARQIVSGVVLQLFLLPLTAWFYYQVPIYAIFLNLMVLPLCSWLLGFGLLGGILGIKFTLCSKWILVLCHWILQIYEKGIGVTNHLPAAQWITGRPSIWLITFYYIVLLWILFGSKQFRLVLAGVLLCALLVSARDYGKAVTYLDVGQGDGICIQNGREVICIDGGSSSQERIGRYYLEPYLKYHGIGHVNAWIVTHGDWDHYSGVLEVMGDGYKIDHLILAEAMPHDSAWEELTQAAKESGTQISYAKQGSSLLLKGAEMECLYPDCREACQDINDSNALSQIWSMKMQGKTFLFMGDLGQEEEEKLLECYDIKDIFVLKAGHHGSKNSSGRMFLQETQPVYTIISCGEKNRYGHPHAETLDRLQQVNSKIVQTKEVGQICFYPKAGKWHLRKAEGPLYNK